MPKREMEITEQAYQSLVEIALWTFETFGPSQAQKYRYELLAKCPGIAQGIVAHRSCRLAFEADLGADLRVDVCGRHDVIFSETERKVRIIDFLHQSADIVGRLER